ncbi:MAG: putative porin [Gammaproteobacteria bacterium]|nr:putative porin [Gammaproteobacteria bacterium]MDH4315201.1 putative porin [Gammaproteobacteria bacterium]MDH5215225.1 putative porin [Gammaproteobacteria bacterium]
MKKMNFTLPALALLAAPVAFGAVSDEDFEQLRRQLAAVSERLDELAAENAELKRSQAQTASVVADVQTSVTEVKDSGSAGSWPERVSLDGDFRYRFEAIDVQGSPSRERNRIRARVNTRADVADNLEVGFGLATGDGDPVSTNQTLGGGGSSKSAVINLAYADWEPVDGLHLLAGKFDNPNVSAGKQPLLFDSDFTPEGLGISYQREWFFANAIGTFLESDTRSNNKNFSWGGQVGATVQLANVELLGGLGYYSMDTRGKSTNFGDPTDPGDFFGNTAVEPGGLPCGTTPGVNCVYLYDYLLTQAFAEASFDIAGMPAAVFADYIENSDAPDDNTGWTVGARIGQTKDRGDLQFGYYYADKGADSLLGLVTDSDFAGGGTDNKGHFLQLGYGVSKSWSIGVQYFINEVDVASGVNSDYNRLMLDTQWKWK